jgi:putative tryptophan/tyrosine transport system substrate-binding protein
VPQATKIYVPYHPEDEVSLTSIKPLPEVAFQLGIELIRDEVRTPAEALATIQRMPTDAALFFVPAPSLEPISTLIEAATKRGITVGSTNNSHLQAGALVTYGASLSAMGAQAARMADQILKGAKPADLPVETAEFFLNINLKTAKAIGRDIPDAILTQANTVIR